MSVTYNYLGDTDTLYILNKLKNVLEGTGGFTPGYVKQVSGKGLSANDFTNALLTKLNGITESADAVSWNQIQDSGTKIATITINDTAIDIYIPTPTAITVDDTMSDSSTNPVQNKVIKAYVDNAVGSVVSIKFDADTTGQGYTSLSDLQTKHPTGAEGTIYLVQNGGSSPNSKDEYIWVQTGTSTGSYEKIGTTDVDLSGYVQASQLNEISTGDIDTMFNAVFGGGTSTSTNA